MFFRRLFDSTETGSKKICEIRSTDVTGVKSVVFEQIVHIMHAWTNSDVHILFKKNIVLHLIKLLFFFPNTLMTMQWYLKIHDVNSTYPTKTCDDCMCIIWKYWYHNYLKNILFLRTIKVILLYLSWKPLSAERNFIHFLFIKGMF